MLVSNAVRFLAVVSLCCIPGLSQLTVGLGAGAPNKARAADGDDSGVVLSAPSLGYLLDGSSGLLRGMRGLAGSGLVGPELPSETTLEMAVWSPAGQYVLGLARESREPILFRLVEGQLRGSSLVPAQPGVSSVHLSPGGRAVALYYAGGERIEIWTGLPDQPVRETELLLPTAGAPVRNVAVSDSGKLALVVLGEDDRQSLFNVREGEWRFLTAAERISSIVFLRNRPDALFADRAANRIYQVQGLDSDPALFAVAGAGEGLQDPSSVEASADGATAFVASATTRSVWSLDLLTSRLTRLECPCVPTGLHRLEGSAVFRLTDSAPDEPVWVLDADDDEPRIVLVPVASRTEGNQ